MSSLTVMILSKELVPEYQKTSPELLKIGASGVGVVVVSVVAAELLREVPASCEGTQDTNTNKSVRAWAREHQD